MRAQAGAGAVLQFFSGIPGGIGAQRGIGNPADPRLRAGEVPQPLTIAGLPAPQQLFPASPAIQGPVQAAGLLADSVMAGDEIVTRAPFTGLVAGTRSKQNPKNARRASRLLEQQRFENAEAVSRGVYGAMRGEWSPENTYIPSDRQVLGRASNTLAALLAGDTGAVRLVDPQMASIPRKTAPNSWSYPQSELGPRPSGQIEASELPALRADGPNMPVDLASLLLQGSKEVDTRDLGASDNERFGAFTSEDPTQLAAKRNSGDIAPYGTVTMPAVDARGRWSDGRGKPLTVTVDPKAVMEVRTVNPDATFASDQVEEVTLGRLVQEAMERNRTPVLSATRLNELAKQGRARLLRNPEGKAYAEVDLIDLEDHAIVRRADGQVETVPASALEANPTGPGDQILGVRRKVPVTRTEIVYLTSDASGDPLRGARLEVNPENPFADPVTTTDRLYRIGSPMATNWDAVRAEIAPLIPGSGVGAPLNRVSNWDLERAVASGQATVTTTPEGQTYVERGGVRNLLVPRTRADGSAVGDFLVRRPGPGVPIGAAPFLVPPADVSPEAARIIGGIRRAGEKKSGESFAETLGELAPGGYMADPTQVDGRVPLLRAMAQGVPLAAIARPGSHVVGPMAPDSTSINRLAQLAAESRGREVDLFPEQPLTPVDQEFVQQVASGQASWGDFGEKGTGGFSVRQGLEVEMPADAFDAVIGERFKDLSPSGRAYLADVARRAAGAQLRAGAQQVDPAAVVAQELERPVTISSAKPQQQRANQLWLTGLPGVPRYATPAAQPEVPDALNAPASSERFKQLELVSTAPDVIPEGVPAAVREGLKRQPGHPAYEAASQFLQGFMARRR